MRLYVCSAWILAFTVATLMGIVHGSWFGVVPPLLVVSAGSAYAWLGVSRTRWPIAQMQHMDDTAQMAFARTLTHGLTGPAAVIADGRITCVNRAWLDLFGWAKEDDQILGMPFTNLVHPQDREHFLMLTRAPAQPRQMDRVGVRAIRSDATEFACDISALQVDMAPEMRLLQFTLPDGE